MLSVLSVLSVLGLIGNLRGESLGLLRRVLARLVLRVKNLMGMLRLTRFLGFLFLKLAGVDLMRRRKIQRRLVLLALGVLRRPRQLRQLVVDVVGGLVLGPLAFGSGLWCWPAVSDRDRFAPRSMVVRDSIEMLDCDAMSQVFCGLTLQTKTAERKFVPFCFVVSFFSSFFLRTTFTSRASLD
ncbi:hypothetical protein B0T26DRAFT_733711 [Lasiosphaeria miniovina]|uniref:Uncharacterized protein n=1 Tax=Lasiosphaeria miniovina TaxID=1954250 RepID=A0AA40DKD7_9PEZI|nr:uncharacterized protein B0T26DRAFT_733711 [Lasiosphaeria miniovina]KAK0704032.1 hypothetical protein B0T26DRAFT_733711 [Lasiosphaeria miniovina]